MGERRRDTFMPDRKTLIYIIGALLAGGAGGTGLWSFAGGDDKMQDYRIQKLEDGQRDIMKALEDIKERLPAKGNR